MTLSTKARTALVRPSPFQDFPLAFKTLPAIALLLAATPAGAEPARTVAFPRAEALASLRRAVGGERCSMALQSPIRTRKPARGGQGQGGQATGSERDASSPCADSPPPRFAWSPSPTSSGRIGVGANAPASRRRPAAS